MVVVVVGAGAAAVAEAAGADRGIDVAAVLVAGVVTAAEDSSCMPRSVCSLCLTEFWRVCCSSGLQTFVGGQRRHARDSAILR